MSAFWKLLAASASGAAILYAGCIALSGLELPWKPTPFDTIAATTSEKGWVNEARYFILNKDEFETPKPRVVVMGASTARDPFRPDVMQAELPGWTVANASLSGAPVDEISDSVDLYYQEQQGHEHGKTVFVFALSYLQLLPSPPNVENPLGAEAKRGGLYYRHEGRLTARYPEPAEELVEAVFRPQAIVGSWPRRLFSAIFVNPDLPMIKDRVDVLRPKDPFSRWTEYIGEQRDLNVVVVPADVRQALLEQRLALSGGDKPLPPDQFAALDHMIAKIRVHGDAVVIADLPLPVWHREGVPVMDQSYRAGVDRVLARFANDPDVAQVSLRAFDGDNNFFDSSHPKPGLWPALSRLLAAELRGLPALRQDTASERHP